MDTSSWKRLSFNYPDRVPTMISPEEKQYLFWLTASVWTGEGSVVEIGPWLGGSTVCLAAGMKSSGREARKKLIVYDNFLWRKFMSDRATLPIRPGDSFEKYFLENIQDYDKIIDHFVRGLPDEHIEDDEEAEEKRFSATSEIPLLNDTIDGLVEILFIDGAKSWRGMCHLLKVLYKNILPGTFIVCQDFKYWGTYWVPIVMVRLRDLIKPVHNVIGGSTVTFRVTSRFPETILEGLEDHVATLSQEETLRELDYAREWLQEDSDIQGMTAIDLCRVRFLAHQNHIGAAVKAFKAIQRRWPIRVNTGQLDQAANYLRNVKKCHVSRSIRLVVISLLRKITGVGKAFC